MTVVAKLAADLTMNIASFVAGATRANGVMDRTAQGFNRGLSGISQGFNTALGGITGFDAALSSLVSGGGLALLDSGALKSAESITTFSDRLGLTTTAFQRYEYGAKLANIQTDDLVQAFGYLNRQIAEGKVPYKNLSQAIGDIADRMMNAKSGIERAGLAQDAFGKGGAKMIPFLMQGKDQIKALGDEAQRLGVVLSDEAVRSATEFQNALQILGTVITRNFQSGLLSGFVGESKNIRDIYTDPQFAEGVKNIGELFGEVAGGVFNSVKAFQAATVSLAALGIEIGKRSKWIDPTVADFALQDAGQRLTPSKAAPSAARPSGTGEGSGDALSEIIRKEKERAATLKDINNQLEREAAITQTQIVDFNEKDHVIKSAVKAKEIEIDLSQKGIVLTDKEHEMLQKKLDLLTEESRQLDQLEEQKKTQEEADKRRKAALEQFAYSFQSSFEDAIVEGKKFSDVLKSIEQDVLHLIIRQGITQPLAKGAMDSGIFDFIGKMLPSFATGISYVPYDMTANIHRGEMIVPADEAAGLRAGGGAGQVNVNIVNNAGARVTASSSDSSSGTDLNIMIDAAVADNISRSGSRTSRALSNLQSRSLIRR